MQQIKGNIFFIYLVIVTVFCGAQNQANIWKCGANMGLNFNTNPPIPISGQTNNVDNTTTISDASGALLFYSDGSTVWNKNNAIMPNGSGLTSNFSAGQCALIVPIPSTSKYVIFCNTEFVSPGQLHYTVVDMSLNAGLGDVVTTQKDISLGTGWTEKACAIYNSNCNYYWVLMHKWSNNQFVALKVDASGVSTNSVTTSIGSIHNCGSYSAAHDAMGQLTISKDGQKVVNALTCQDKFDLFDFDINTGILSNFISIPGNGGNAWGTGFSQDSKKLYVNSIFGQDIFQYDLSTYNAAAIISSKISLYNTGTGGYNFGYMELGPDNKMYIPRPSTIYFSVINSPNNLGAASGFSFSGLNVTPYTTTHGISRIAYNIGTSASSNSGTISSTSSSSNVLCFGASTASASVIVSSPGTYNYLWSPGNYTTSSVSNLSAGIYTVSISNGACNTTTTTVTITQPASLTSSLTSSSYSVCENQAVTLNSIISGGTPSYSVNWTTGATNTYSVNDTPSTTSVYGYTVTDANLCSNTATLSVAVIQNPIINLNSQNTCSGVTTTLVASGASSYTWQPGNVNTNINVVTPTSTIIYTISGILNNCLSTNVFTVNVNPTPFITVDSQSICAGQQAILSANSSNNTYVWMPGGQTSSTISVQPTTNMNYTVMSAIGSCTSIAISTVSVYAIPSLITNSNVSVCTGQSYSLNVSGASTYTWNPTNSHGTSLIISPTSNSIYTVSGTSIHGCVSSEIIAVNIVNSLSVALNSAVICEGEKTLLVANSNGTIFHWEPATLAANPNTSSTFVYPLTTTIFTLNVSYNGLCNTTATTVVIVNPKPSVFAGNDTTVNMDEPLSLNGIGNYNFGWISTNGSVLDCNYCPSIVVNPQNNTCYVLESRTNFGCVNFDTVCVFVTHEWAIYVPNAFSPNGDGKNDVFIPVGYGIKDYELNIFDRWGELIFKSDEDNKGWNGSYKGAKCQIGVYTYKLYINTQADEYKEKVGHVTLVSQVK